MSKIKDILIKENFEKIYIKKLWFYNEFNIYELICFKKDYDFMFLYNFKIENYKTELEKLINDKNLKVYKSIYTNKIIFNKNDFDKIELFN